MKRFAILMAFLCVIMTVRVAIAQNVREGGPGRGPDPNAPPGGTIVKLDPALDELIAADAKLEVLRENRWDYGEHGIVRYEKDGSHTLVVGTYEGEKFNCPNKLVVKKNGSIYFTDPSTGCIKGGDQSPEREIPYHGLYLVKDGKATLLAKDPMGGAPHGITMSPDEKVLYIGAGRKILAYDIKSDDTIENERVFHECKEYGLEISRSAILTGRPSLHRW